jgi:hypothetical protein
MVRRQARDKEGAQRQAIQKARQQAAAQLAKKVETLQHVRSLAAAQAAARRNKSATAAAKALEEAGCAREETVLAMAAKLEAKRAAAAQEKARLTADEKQTKFWRQQAKSGAAEVSCPAAALLFLLLLVQCLVLQHVDDCG